MRQPFERLLVGRTLAGRYELEEVIGSGGMSVVYRGRDRVLGRPVAVKVVALPAESDEGRDVLRERFRREAASAAGIPPHPNVVQVYDFGTDPELDLDFIVMELLRGRDLKQAVAAGPMPVPEAVRVLREAARGIAAGHREGLVHRDVKPANVFLVDGGSGAVDYVRVLDFGIAKPLEPGDDDALTTLGAIPHSPAYSSPEQLDPDVPVAAASDVYQLGLIGYELLTGDRAYSEAERKRIAAGEEVPLVSTPLWSAVPAPIREVIERALRRDPAARYPDAGAFAEALSHAASPDATVISTYTPADDETVMLPPPAAPAPPCASPLAAVVGDAAPSASPAAVPAPAARKRSIPAWALALLAAVLVLGMWAALRRKADSRDAAAPAAPDSAALAELESRFLALQGLASRRLDGDTLPAESTAAPVEADTPKTAPPPAPQETGDVAAVNDVVTTLHVSWTQGDLDRMMSLYANRVDFYLERRVSRSFIRRYRAKDVAKYPQRTITIRNRAVTFPDPEHARAIVDKDWDFRGSGERWTGSMRQQLDLRRTDDGRWQIVAEKTNQMYRSDKTKL